MGMIVLIVKHFLRLLKISHMIFHNSIFLFWTSETINIVNPFIETFSDTYR